MKRLKYLVVAMLVFFGLALPGEIYQNYVINFMSDLNVSFECPDNIQCEEMLQQILDEAYKNNIKMYYVEKNIVNLYYEDIKIYCDYEVMQYIKEKYGIESGRVRSFVSGESNVTFMDWDELSGEVICNNPNGYYMLLSLEEAKKLDIPMVDKYNNSSKGLSYSESKLQYEVVFCIIWLIFVCIVSYISYYISISMRKEITIRMTMGDSLYARAIRYIIADFLICVIITLVVWGVTSNYAGKIFLFEIAIVGSVVMICINTAILFVVLRGNYKKAFANLNVNSKILKMSYVIKMISSVVLVLSIAGNVVDSVAYIEVLSQKSIYEKYKGYKYIDFKASNDSKNPYVWFGYSSYFYQKNIRDMDIVSFEWIVDDVDYDVCMVNANFKWYLEKHMAEFNQVNSNTTNYMFIPISYKGSVQETDIRNWNMYLSDNIDDKVIYYEGNLRFPVQNSYITHPYTYLDNPIICYSEQTDFSDSIKKENWGISQITLNRYFVNISDEEIAAVKEEVFDMGVDVVVTDVYDIYQYELLVMKRVFVCNTVVSVVLLLILVMLITTIIRLEYIANRKEIAIKKTLGYSLISRFKNIYLSTLITGSIGLMMVGVLIKNLDITYGHVVGIIALLITLIEIGFITVNCYISDKSNIQRILKNGF